MMFGGVTRTGLRRRTLGLGPPRTVVPQAESRLIGCNADRMSDVAAMTSGGAGMPGVVIDSASAA